MQTALFEVLHSQKLYAMCFSYLVYQSRSQSTVNQCHLINEYLYAKKGRGDLSFSNGKQRLATHSYFTADPPDILDAS